MVTRQLWLNHSTLVAGRTAALPALAAAACLCPGPGPGAAAATVQPRYYAHQAVHDAEGVIAPWYSGQNGVCDFRIRVAVDTLLRYPWTDPATAVAAVPAYILNGHWRIAADGTITVPTPVDWDNGDLGQRAAYVLAALVEYYRYSGDAAAIAHLTYQADALLDYALTGPDHPWPGFLVSVPVKGKVYGRTDPHGMIQLDIVAEAGIGLLAAYQLTGNQRWFDAARHWGDLLAAKRNLDPAAPPWGRYANPEDTPWKDNKQTGGVVFLLHFFDALLRLGYRGDGDAIVAARDAGRAYLRDVLLPAWTVDDTWGRNYWDWVDPVQAENVTEFAARYLMDNRDAFPNWRNDVRNILSLFLHRTSVGPASRGDVYSGAWAFPESSGCCGRSLWYPAMELAWPFAQYGVEADSEWARELARRMQLLATYDGHDTGVSEDNIDGGFVVNDGWFKIAHPMALRHLLATMGWLPEVFAPSRGNHLLRTGAVVTSILYGDGRIAYTAFDAPPNTVDVLRLAFTPRAVTADDQPLPLRQDLAANGYTLRQLANGDCLVSVRHDGRARVTVAGDDPQQIADDPALTWDGDWQPLADERDSGGSCRVARAAGAAAGLRFRGNQVRVLGRVDRDGGLADVYLDGTRQLAGVDAWNPAPRHAQVLFQRSGLPTGGHELRLVLKGCGNPRSSGAAVWIDAVAWSDAEGVTGFGSGGGPTEAQRFVFGYSGRSDCVDAAGNTWRPGTEVVTPLRPLADAVARTWWSVPCPEPIAATPDPDLYRYGLHAREFWVNVTVGPGTYHARLRFAATRRLDPRRNCVSVAINGREVVRRMDVGATAGGPYRALDLGFNDLRPSHGVIEIRFTGGDSANGIDGEAFLQALEVGPGPGSPSSATPVCVGENLLANPGFEDGVPAATEAGGHGQGWSWSLRGPGNGRLVAESATAGDTASTPAEPGAEREAARISVSDGAAASLQQVVPVLAAASYVASAFVRLRAPAGAAPGTDPVGIAGLRATELNATGGIVAEHRQALPSGATGYTYLAAEFRTAPTTTKVQFALDVAGTAAEATFDCCALDGPPPALTVRGKVTHRGQPLAAAQVTIGDRSVTTDAAGEYVLPGVPAVRRPLRLLVAADGCYPCEKRLVLDPEPGPVDVELIGPPQQNLLVNPGFEDGIPEYVRSGPTGGNGWSFVTLPGNSVIAPESFYTQHRSLGCPEYHGGKQAVRVSSTYGNDRIRLFQDVPVRPGARYLASAFIRTRDFEGDGFGHGVGDAAGVHVQELNAKGEVVADHPRAQVTGVTGYTCVWLALTTRPETRQVRFALDSQIACLWTQGNVTYDDCALDGPPAAPGPP